MTVTGQERSICLRPATDRFSVPSRHTADMFCRDHVTMQETELDEHRRIDAMLEGVAAADSLRTGGYRSFVQQWRAREDSNSQPSDP